MSPRITLLRNALELRPYLDHWRNWAPTPMQSPEWLLAWWSTYQLTTCQLAVLLIQNQDNEPIGLAPFYFRDSWALGRSLRFLGSGKACSDFQTLLSAPGQDAVVAEAIADWLVTAKGETSWGFVELEGVTADDLKLTHLESHVRQFGCRLQSRELENTWRLDLTEGFEAFLARLSKTQKRQARNFVNRFDKQDRWSLRKVESVADMPVALQQFMDLHQRRWQAVGQPGCFAEANFRTFLHNACCSLAANGQVTILLLEDNGAPIASHLYLTDSAGSYMYQSGRAPERDAERVGQILNLVAIREACQQGWQFIDYLRGNEGYKARLGALAAKCMRTRVVSAAPLPRLRDSIWSLGVNLRDTAKKVHARYRHVPLLPAEEVSRTAD